MIEYPETQRKAQEELDRIVGRGRFPDFSDMENLPYVKALYKEVLRYHPIVPIGVPHSCIADNEYMDMMIPKGAVVISNVW
jgi:cytochrome P450